jgi:hypothetical protein
MSSFILIQTLATKSVTIYNSTFVRNIGISYGVFYVSPSDPGSALFQYNLFMNNSARQGAVIFLPSTDIDTLSLSSNQFVNNEARLYGSSMASVAVRMEWVKSNLSSAIHVVSGDVLPPFSVTVVDIFSTVIVPRELQVDFFFVNITLIGDDAKRHVAAQIEAESQKGMLQGEKWIEFRNAEVVGIPGRYELLIAPALNYDRDTFYLNSSILIKQCESPKVNFQSGTDAFPRCITRNVTAITKAFPLSHMFASSSLAFCDNACNEPNGKCVDVGKCVCSSRLEGLDCGIQKGNFVSLKSVWLGFQLCAL